LGSSLANPRLYDRPAPTISFEFFPPKNDEAIETLFAETVPGLKALNPSFISVTYGAGGGTRATTTRIVQRIRRKARIESMPHLTCVGSTQEMLGDFLDEILKLGFRERPGPARRSAQGSGDLQGGRRRLLLRDRLDPFHPRPQQEHRHWRRLLPEGHVEGRFSIKIGTSPRRKSRPGRVSSSRSSSTTGATFSTWRIPAQQEEREGADCARHFAVFERGPD